MINIESPDFGEEKRDVEIDNDVNDLIDDLALDPETIEKRKKRVEAEEASKKEDESQASLLSELIDANEPNSYVEERMKQLEQELNLESEDKKGLERVLNEQELMINSALNHNEDVDIPEEKRKIKEALLGIIETYKSESDPLGFIGFYNAWLKAKENGTSKQFIEEVINRTDLTDKQKKLASEALQVMFEDEFVKVFEELKEILTEQLSFIAASEVDPEKGAELRVEFKKNTDEHGIAYARVQLRITMRTLAEENPENTKLQAFINLDDEIREREIKVFGEEEAKEPTETELIPPDVGFSAVIEDLPAETADSIEAIKTNGIGGDVLIGNLENITPIDGGASGVIRGQYVRISNDGQLSVYPEEQGIRGNFGSENEYTARENSVFGFIDASARMIADQNRMQYLAENPEMTDVIFGVVTRNVDLNTLPQREDFNRFRNFLLVMFNGSGKNGKPDKGAERQRLLETGIMNQASVAIDRRRLRMINREFRKRIVAAREYDETPPNFEYKHALAIALALDVDDNWRPNSKGELNKFANLIEEKRQTDADWRPESINELEQLA